MASRLQDVILRGIAADRPASTDAAPGSLYYSTDTLVLERVADDGLSWEVYGAGVAGVTPHAATHAAGGGDDVTLTQAQITGLVADLAALVAADAALAASLAGKASTTHASTHASAGSDPLSVLTLGGFPGGTTDFLRADGSFAAPPGGGGVSGVTFPGPGCTFDGGGSALSAGGIRYVLVPYAHTITRVYMLGDQSGSAVVDVWRLTFGAALPTVANTITASAKPTLSGAVTSLDSTLTGWSTSGSAFDVYAFKLDSVSTLTVLQVQLVVTR